MDALWMPMETHDEMPNLWGAPALAAPAVPPTSEDSVQPQALGSLAPEARPLTSARSESGWLEREATRHEQLARDDIAEGHLDVTQVSNVGDASQARALLGKLTAWDGQMEAGRAQGEGTLDLSYGIKRSHVLANEHCKNALGDYLFSLGEESRTGDDFQAAYQRTALDFARLRGMASGFDILHGGGAGYDDAGDALLGGLGTSAKAMAEDTRKLGSDAGSTFNGSMLRLQALHTELEGSAAAVGIQQQLGVNTTFDVLRALSEIQAGAIPREDTAPEATAALGGVRAQCASFKGWVSEGLSAVKTLAPGIPGVVATGVEKAAHKALDLAFEKPMQALEAQIQVAEMHSKDHALTALKASLRSALAAWKAAIGNLNKAQLELQNGRNELRTLVDKLKTSALSKGGKGNGNIAIALGFLGEAETFVVQCDAAVGLGEAQQTAGGFATAERQTLHRDKGMPYFEPVKRYHHAIDGWRFEPRPWNVEISTWGDRFGGSVGPRGVNTVIEKCIVELKHRKEVIVGMRRALGGALGMGDLGGGRKDGPNTVPGGI